ncbi:MAG TPA: PQQ-binding-like beta-propeller repeat protein [Verrucomicrobiales bacterium]|nr:PQQ-binding-like beta-propeller repeat protein [Verrucomicrobiales bacterium]
MILRSLVLALVLACSPASADDWPEILGPKRRGISQETGWNIDWNAKEPPVRWKVELGKGASSCAIAGGRVYTMGSDRAGDTESVICLDAATGKEIWRKTYDCEADASSWTGGPAATPVIDGDRVYTLSFRGQLYCWNTRDGEKRWELHLETAFKGIMPRWGWAGSPLVVGNMLVIEPGGNGSSRAAVDKLTGKVFWQSGTDPAAYASPVIFSGPAMRGVALFNASGLVGINPRDGTELFRHEWKTRFDVNAAIPVHRDGRFFIGSGYGSGVAMFDLKAGRIWENNKIMLQFQSPVLFGDHLYMVGGEANSAATLQCIDWITGKVAWTQPAGKERGHLIIAGGKLIVATQPGEVILADASPAAYKELGRIQALPAEIYAAPAFSERNLYVRNNKGTLVCLDLSP